MHVCRTQNVSSQKIVATQVGFPSFGQWEVQATRHKIHADSFLQDCCKCASALLFEACFMV